MGLLSLPIFDRGRAPCFPPANETLTYDLDGNLTSDARWLYTWDAENRLIQMEERAGPAPRPALQRLTFTYDSQSRRIRKVVESHRDSNWSVTSDLRFLYDDWNLVGEFAVNPLQPSSLILQHSFAWGYDLSGTMQGAGGVGGLRLAKSFQLSAFNSPLSLAPAFDGNGNLTAWVDVATGTAVQRMEYDAFGNELSLDSALVHSASGPQPSTFNSQLPSYGFSTKYTDRETGLCYYGFRYYSPELGRWTARDPIEEKGGVNVYSMCGNDAGNSIDLLGMTDLFGGFSGTVAILGGMTLGLGIVIDTDNWMDCGVYFTGGIAWGFDFGVAGGFGGVSEIEGGGGAFNVGYGPASASALTSTDKIGDYTNDWINALKNGDFRSIPAHGGCAMKCRSPVPLSVTLTDTQTWTLSPSVFFPQD